MVGTKSVFQTSILAILEKNSKYKGYFQLQEMFWSTHTIHHRKPLFKGYTFIIRIVSYLWYNSAQQGRGKNYPSPQGRKMQKKVIFSSNNDSTRKPVSYPRHYWIRTYYTTTESPNQGLQFRVFVLCLWFGSKRCKPTKEGAIFGNFGQV